MRREDRRTRGLCRASPSSPGEGEASPSLLNLHCDSPIAPSRDPSGSPAIGESRSHNDTRGVRCGEPTSREPAAAALPPNHATSDDRLNAEPLRSTLRARGRRLSFASHPLGMTFHVVFTQHLPTLALVSLGASEALVGLQNAFIPASQILQLPTLRAIGRIPKRTILVAGQAMAVLVALPLAAFGHLTALGNATAIVITLCCLALVSVGIQVSQTVWFPLLRSYVEPGSIGRFFGALRTSWSLALILYFIGAQVWLARHPGDFGPLFAAGIVCGVLRLLVIARLPERSERTGESIRVREALALLRQSEDLRRYLQGATASSAVHKCVIPFGIVMMRREIGFSESDIVYTTIAYFAGSLVSLYGWGRIVDRVGAAPIFRGTALATGSLLLCLLLIREPGSGALFAMIGFFFAFSVLSSGFGVADTDVLFALTPAEAPARTLVLAQTIVALVSGAAPILVGSGLQLALARCESPLAVYHAFFAAAALLQAVSYLPLRRFTAAARASSQQREA